jgi:general nucleoside transport system permease protein
VSASVDSAEPAVAASVRREDRRPRPSFDAARDALVALIGAVAVSALLMLVAGYDPVLALQALFEGGFGTSANISSTLNLAAPLLLSAVGAAIAFRAGVWNIGQEGQIALGGAGAAFVALELPGFEGLPPVLAITLCLVAGFVVGGLWASLTTLARLIAGANEVIVSLLLAFVGVLVTSFFISGPLFLDGAGFPQSEPIPSSGWLWTFSTAGLLHVGIVIGILVAFVAWVVMGYTRTGYRLRVVGASVPAASYGGISYARQFALAMLISGGTAGLAGAVEVLGSQHKLIIGFSTGFGFTSLAAALLAGLNPLACVLTAVLFAFITLGGVQMQQVAEVPAALTSVMQGVIILFVICGVAGGAYRRERRAAVTSEESA